MDYKIIAKFFSSRMKKVVDSIINPGQVCAIPGRCLWENLFIVRDVIEDVLQRKSGVIEDVLQRKSGVAVLSLDFEKAYDRVNHSFIFKVLEKFGFGENFIKNIRVLYKDVTSEILVNGFKITPIDVKSGVRQGCPLSPILFICSIEQLLLSFQKDKVIRVVDIPGKKESIKVLGYMDDVVVMCSNKEAINRTILWTTMSL